jgi:hypothetical protein
MGSTSNDAIDLTRQKKERKEVEYETVYTIGKWNTKICKMLFVNM